MNERRQNIAVGLTALMGIFGLAFMLLLFGYLPGWLQQGYAVKVELNQATGLHESGIVTYRGIEVGTVTSIELVAPPDTGVVAMLLIRDNVRLPANVYATLEASMLTSSATLGLQADDWPQENGTVAFLPLDGSAVIQGQSTSAVDIFNNVASQIEALSDEWVMVGKNLNLLLEPRSTDEVDSGDMLGNAATVIARIDTRLAELKEVMAGVDRYVNDPKLLEDVKTAAANARKLSSEAPQHLQSIRDRYIALADDLGEAVSSFKKLADAARSGEGAMGKLMTDPQLYNNLNDAFQRLQKAIDEMRLLVQKWKDEGVPIQL